MQRPRPPPCLRARRSKTRGGEPKRQKRRTSSVIGDSTISTVQPILTFTRPLPLLTLFVGLKLILAPTCYRVAIMASASIRRRPRPRHPSGPPRAHKTGPSRPRRPRRPTSKGNPQGPQKRNSIFAIGSFREEQGSGQQVGRSSERITLTHTHHGGVGRGNEVDGAEDSAAEGEKPSVRSAHTAREPGASIEEENGPRADLTVLPPAYPPPPPPSRSRPRRAPGTRRAGRRG